MYERKLQDLEPGGLEDPGHQLGGPEGEPPVFGHAEPGGAEDGAAGSPDVYDPGLLGRSFSGRLAETVNAGPSNAKITVVSSIMIKEWTVSKTNYSMHLREEESVAELRNIIQKKRPPVGGRKSILASRGRPMVLQGFACPLTRTRALLSLTGRSGNCSSRSRELGSSVQAELAVVLCEISECGGKFVFVSNWRSEKPLPFSKDVSVRQNKLCLDRADSNSISCLSATSRVRNLMPRVRVYLSNWVAHATCVDTDYSSRTEDADCCDQ